MMPSKKSSRVGGEGGGMRDLIDNWWIPINLSFLPSGATQWGRIIFRELPGSKNNPKSSWNW